MQEKENNIDTMINNTFKKLKEIIDNNISIGKKIEVGDNNYIIPVSKVSVGVVAGGGKINKSKLENMVTTSGISVIPLGFLSVINNSVNYISVSSDNCLVQKMIENIFKITEKIIDESGVDNEN